MKSLRLSLPAYWPNSPEVVASRFSTSHRIIWLKTPVIVQLLQWNWPPFHLGR